MAGRLAVLIVLAACAGCRGGAGHPVRRSLPRLPDAAVVPTPAAAFEPQPPDDLRAVDELFQGIEGVKLRILMLAKRPAPSGRTPRIVDLPQVARSVEQRYRGGGPSGPIRSVAALGLIGWVPIPPHRLADIMVDPEAERQLFAAQTFRTIETVYELPNAMRKGFYVEKLNMKIGPARYHLRFAISAERIDLSDGCVWLRYDPRTRPRPQGVTLYRGGAWLQPERGGTRVVELTLFGVDLGGLVWKLGRPLVDKTFNDRAVNLWIRAWR